MIEKSIEICDEVIASWKRLKARRGTAGSTYVGTSEQGGDGHSGGGYGPGSHEGGHTLEKCLNRKLISPSDALARWDSVKGVEPHEALARLEYPTDPMWIGSSILMLRSGTSQLSRIRVLV